MGAILVAVFLLCSSPQAFAQSLTINNVGNPTVVGSGASERAIWPNGGSVGGVNIDIVAKITQATIDHSFTTTSSRPSVTSSGQDNIFVDWFLFQAGTYDINTDTGGVAVTADVHVQFNDVDGPNNERVFVPVCAGEVEWIRIDSAATTGRAFGTVAGQPETFSLIGDSNYNHQPESGLEVRYPNTSTFTIGRTANSGFLIRLDNPTYSAFDTYDYNCGDFVSPVAVDDSREGTPGAPTSLAILVNDTNATANDNPPANNTLQPSEFGKLSVALVPPAGATGITYNALGNPATFTVPGEGAWAYDSATGDIQFTPDPSFKGYATTIDYTYENALGQVSNVATITVWYPAIGAVKSATFNDENSDGYAQAGETVSYQYVLTAYGAEPLQNVQLTETTFTGTGSTPTPAYQSGDTNGDGFLGLSENWLYTASYTLTADDVNSGGVTNQATAQGQTSIGTVTTDLSDSTGPGDGDGTGTPGPGPNNGDVTLTTLSRAPIVANDDSAPGIVDNSAGDVIGVINVLADNGSGTDQYAGAQASIPAVTINAVGTLPTGITLNADGSVDVASSVGQGTYNFDYDLCEAGNPAHCDRATVTISVGSASVGLVKSAAFNDESGNGYAETGETISYTYTVSNLGNLALSNVNITEAAPGFTGAGSAPTPSYVSGDTNTDGILDPSETWIFNANYALVAADLSARSVSNSATVTAESPSGQPVNDLSDSDLPGDGNGIGTPGGGGGNDDPTVTSLGPLQVLANDDDLSGTPVNGLNGNTSLVDALNNDTLGPDPATLAVTILSVTTPAAPVTPGANVPVLDTGTGTVSVPANTPASTYTIIYRLCETADPTNCDDATITIAVAAAPIIANDDPLGPVDGLTGGTTSTVLVNDTLNGSPVVPADLTTVLTDHGGISGLVINPDGTLIVPPNTPSGNYSIVYRICENLNPANCDTANVALTVAPPAITANDDVSAAVDTASPITAAVLLVTNDTINGNPVNAANVTISVPAGLPSGFTIQPDSSVDIAQYTPSGDYIFTYRICENLNPANCDEAQVTIPVRKSVPVVSGIVFLDEDGDGIYDSGTEPGQDGYTVQLVRHGAVVTSVAANSDGTFEIRDFPIGDEYRIVFIDAATGIGVGHIDNLDIQADTVLTQQNQPIDPSGVVYDSSSGAPLTGVSLVMTDATGSVLPAACLLPGQQPQTTGADGRYRFDVVAGAAAQCPTGETEYRISTTSPTGYTNGVSALVPPQPGALDATTCPGDAVPGGACQLSADSNAPAAGSPTPYYLAFLLATGDPNVVNNHIPLDPEPRSINTGLTVVKTASSPVVQRGGRVSYSIRVTNQNLFAVGPVDIVDQMPTGFLFEPGSASVNGAPVTVTNQGSRVTFENLTVPASGELVATLVSRISTKAGPGDHTNVATLVDAVTGNLLAPAGRATVRIEVEHVFDCGDVIGKVFDDRNRNGVQNNNEAGLPGVRLATVRGELITTDKHGRFSIGCAELPEELGSNFILKLDPRTLPADYSVTTENPRVVRLTRGKMTKINFGAARSGVVEIALSGKAFQAGTANLKAGTDRAIATIVRQVESRKATLRITYQAAEGRALVNRRIAEFERRIKRQWQRRNARQLNTEFRIVGGN